MKRTPSSVLSLAALALASCGTPADTLSDGRPVLEDYAAILHAEYDDARIDALDLRTSAQPLFASGTSASAAALTGARDAWRDARVTYMQTEAARFYGGPIADHSAYTNEWPIDEAQIDYVAGTGGAPSFGGIVNMPSAVPTIDAAALRDANLPTGSETVTVGFHAIEFLLWGQDLRADGAGDRLHTDFVDGMQMNADRRRAYLDVTTQMLVGELTAVRDAWAPGASNYRAEFVALEPREGVHRILIGLIRLLGGEIGDDRILPAYTDKLQEDEHSCFSDNTSADLLNDVQGAVNVYEGQYTRTDGTVVGGHGLSDLVRARDAALDARVRAALQAVLTHLAAWPTTASCPSATLQGMCPFDQLFLGVDSDPGRIAMWQVHTELEDLAALLQTDVAATLGVTITPADLSND